MLPGEISSHLSSYDTIAVTIIRAYTVVAAGRDRHERKESIALEVYPPAATAAECESYYRVDT